MAVWSGLGINYGHTDSNYSQSQVDVDINFLYNIGFRKIRIAMSAYNSDDSTLNRLKYMVTAALSKGFYVIWGVCTPTEFTDVIWSAYKTYVSDTLAPWAQSLNNANFELSLGNEDESHNTGSNAPSDATVRSDIRALATTCQSIYTVGPIGYQAVGTNLVDWISEGRGNIDKIGFNIYGTVPNFNNAIRGLYTAFGANLQITEWNIEGGYATSPNEDLNEQIIRDKLKCLIDVGINAAYFFTYNHSTDAFGMANWSSDNNYSLLKEDRSEYRLAFQTLTGGRRWFINT